MQKVLSFLEKNVQWVAIGLGGAYLLFMVYSYIANSPNSVPVGQPPVVMSPGRVDEFVAQNYSDKLKDMMDHAPSINITVPNFSSVVNLKVPSDQFPPLVSNWSTGIIDELRLLTPLSPLPGGPNPPTIARENPQDVHFVEALPKLPAAIDLASATGRSNVVLPTSTPAAAAVEGQPAAGPTGTDIAWVTVAYKIPLADLAAAFEEAKVPHQQAFATSILDVRLYRQEFQVGGKWSDSSPVAKLLTSTQPPFPPDETSHQTLQQYLTWATGAETELLHPKFYALLRGDPWKLPGDTSDDAAPAAPQFGPNEIRPGFDPAHPPADPTMAEKRKIAEYKQAEADKAAAARGRGQPRPQPRGGGAAPARPRGGGGGRGGGRGRTGMADPVNPGTANVIFAQVQEQPNQQVDENGNVITTPAPAASPSRAGRAGRGAAAAPAAPPPAADNAPVQAQQPADFTAKYPLPPPQFDPRDDLKMPAITGWIHDTTAQPGKTYRYMVRYKLKSPVWATDNVTKPKELANQFALTSPDSEWTAPVIVPSAVNFYVVAVPKGNQMQCDVYRWQAGKLNKHTFTVSPGDRIGKTDGGIDYSTGYTLVDVPNESVAWLLTPEGLLIRRDIKADIRQIDQMKRNGGEQPRADAK